MRPVPPPFLPIPLSALGRPPARGQDLLVWGWLRLREGQAPTPLPAKAYIARCLHVRRETVSATLERLTRTDPPLLFLHPGRGEDGRPAILYRTADLEPEAARRVTPPSPKGEPDRLESTTARPKLGHPPGQESATARPKLGHPPGQESATARPKLGHDVIEETSETTERQREEPATDSVSLFPEAYRNDLNDTQRRLVRSAFPFGCTAAQFRRLMQGVVSAKRSGCPDTFIAYGVGALLEDDQAPWEALARQVEFLREDVREVGICFKAPIYDVPALRAWLSAHR